MSREGRIAAPAGPAPGRLAALDRPLALRLGAAALAGLLYGAAVPPSAWSGLGWIAPAPLLWALWGSSPARGFWLGFAFGLVAFGAGLGWIRTFGIPAWVLLSAYLALYTGAFGAAAAHLARGRSAAWLPWIGAASWTAVEFARSLGMTAFPWALLAHTQWDGPFLGLASIAGVPGISFVLALAAGLPALALIDGRTRTAAASAVAALAVIAGAVVAARAASAAPLGAAVRVAALQPNVPVLEKFDPAFAARNLDVLRRQTLEAARDGAALVAWPESAAGFASLFAPPVSEEVAALARAARVTLLASSIEPERTNTAVLFAPDGRVLGRYDKVRLVAFGEAGTRPGRAYAVHATPVGPVGIGICFESIFPDISRTLARRGAAVLAIVTNDAWSAGTSGPEQHAVLSVLRAAETGLPVVRAANTGVSMLIDGRGRVLASAPEGRQAVLVGRIAGRRDPTPYVRLGDWLGWLALAAVAAGTLVTSRDGLRAMARTPEFRRAALAAGLPLVSVPAAIAFGPAGRTVALYAALAAVAAASGWRDWGWRPRAFAPALVLGAGTVGALALALVTGYQAKGIAAGLVPPPGGWLAGTAWLVLAVGLPIEAWLRGAAYQAVAAWRGWPAAVVAATALGMVAVWPATPEGLGWALVAGAALGLVRARLPSVPALAMAHALGLALITFLTVS